ncbi:MAG TPA: hypothetical protein VG816_14580 [Solirubrobacterales bacterium]|nr:hypothetical protein [Solirubrobacterales bacterium]
MKRALLALIACLALALGGCGGSSDDSASTSSTTTEATTADAPQGTTPEAQGGEKGEQGEGKSGGSSTQDGNPKQQGDKSNDSSSSPHPVKPPRVSSAPVAGSKAPAPGVKTVKGGDNSVQEYGVEGDEAERREAAIALQAYLDARAEGDWPRACSLLAKPPTEQLEKLAGGKADCAEVLKATAKGPPSQPGSEITEVLSLRGEGGLPGDPSYLIFEGPPGSTLFSMPMYLEGGAWKAGLAQPSELPV